ncbi:MAG: hypothetical protein ACKVQB_00490 [Bacteroidia bacterium]
MKNLFLLISGLLFFSQGYAEEGKTAFLKKIKAESFQINVFTNQYYFPFLGMGNIFTSQYHPGISAGIVKNIKKKEKVIFYYDAKIGVYHHRFIQTGVQFYGDLGYRINLPKKFFLAGEFGLGYLHAIIHQTKYESDENGNYSKIKSIGKPQMMTGIGIKLGKQVSVSKNTGRLFFNYQPWFQFPFIKSYVPLLPNNSLHIGFDLILK